MVSPVARTYARGPAAGRWLALAAALAWALVATFADAPAAAQGVTEEIEGGGVMLSPEDLAPPDEGSAPGGVTEQVEGGAALGSEGLGAPTDPGPTAGEPTEGEPVDEPRLEAIDLEAGPGPAPGPLAPEPTELRLANGLRVILQPVPERRFVAVTLAYRAGAAHAPSGWSGLPHLAEHLLFSGTDALTGPELLMRLEAAGAVTRDGETTPDHAVFTTVLPRAQLRWALWVEAQRMARTLAGLDERRLERQRELVRHEAAERGTYGWPGLLRRALHRGVFGEEHPYRQLVAVEGDLGAVRLRHAQWFLQRFYAPGRATLALVGGFEPAAARAAIERHLGPVLASAPGPEPLDVPEDEARGGRVDVAIPGRRDRLLLGWRTAAAHGAADAALHVLADALGEDLTGPLWRALVGEGLASALTVRQRSLALGSLFVIEAVAAEGADAEALRAAVERALAALRADGLPPAQVARAVARRTRALRLGALDLEARARALATAPDGALPTLEAERRRYAAVDAAAVNDALRRWLASAPAQVRGLADPAHPPSGERLEDAP